MYDCYIHFQNLIIGNNTIKILSKSPEISIIKIDGDINTFFEVIDSEFSNNLIATLDYLENTYLKAVTFMISNLNLNATFDNCKFSNNTGDYQDNSYNFIFILDFLNFINS